MFKSLYSKLALALLLLFCVTAVALIYTTGIMIDSRHIVSTVTELLVGALMFMLVAGLLVFGMLTRRLRDLANEVDAFRDSNFTGQVRIKSADPHGDEIDRLGYAFEQMERRMVEQVERLQQIDVMRRDLLANVSHDLRTPLASMRGYLETLLLKEGSLSREEQRNYLEVAAKQSDRLGKLVANLFELTKLDAHEVALNPEPFAIAELLQDVAQKFGLAANERNVRIETSFTASALQVNADIGLIERVLENLIENALRHCPSGAVIRLGLEGSEGRVAVEVTDTGAGIGAEDLPHVFERHYRAERSASGGGGGAGLGLAITKRILDLHGAEIKVQSMLGRGTTFRFELPAAA
jgi:signal transduction histidine kinase